jgi:hypothetical protein
MKRFCVVLGLVMLLAAGGCGALKNHPHPNQANTFDGGSYDTLIVAHSVIESTKADLAGNAFPASWTSKIHDTLNGLIRAYDAAQASYTVYHTAAMAGAATTAQSTDLQNKLNDVNAQTAALAAAKAGK